MDSLVTGITIPNNPLRGIALKFKGRIVETGNVQENEAVLDADSFEQPFQEPALILLGRYDVATGYKDAWNIYDNFPNGTFVVINQAGHSLPIEQPGLFNAHVASWISQILKDRGGK